jgi:hypothetical protein
MINHRPSETVWVPAFAGKAAVGAGKAVEGALYKLFFLLPREGGDPDPFVPLAFNILDPRLRGEGGGRGGEGGGGGLSGSFFLPSYPQPVATEGIGGYIPVSPHFLIAKSVRAPWHSNIFSRCKA